MNLKVEIVPPEPKALTLADLDEHLYAECQHSEGIFSVIRYRTGEHAYGIHGVQHDLASNYKAVSIINQTQPPAEPTSPQTLRDLKSWTWAICEYGPKQLLRLRCHDGACYVWGLDEDGVLVIQNLLRATEEYKVLRIIGRLRHTGMEELENQKVEEGE